MTLFERVLDRWPAFITWWVVIGAGIYVVLVHR